MFYEQLITVRSPLKKNKKYIDRIFLKLVYNYDKNKII